MDLSLLLRQGVLCLHLLAFAIALGTLLREDASLLIWRRINTRRLARTARTLSAALAVLWVSGLALVGWSVGLDPSVIAATPKIAAKFVVVLALTINGVALHALAFPQIRRLRTPGTLALLLGAVSSASWLVSAFIGASRLVAPWLSFGGYMAVYGLSISVAAASALFIFRRQPEPAPAAAAHPACPPREAAPLWAWPGTSLFAPSRANALRGFRRPPAGGASGAPAPRS